MTAAAEMVARCRILGIDLTAGPDGGLTWEAETDPPADLLAELAASKTELLALLRAAEAQTPLPPWDQGEADRLLAELRSEVERVKAGFRGPLPGPLAVLLDDAVAVGERYVHEHTAEAARGWDAMALLAELAPLVRDLVARWGRAQAGAADTKRAS
jgi:hypothetical protein